MKPNEMPLSDESTLRCLYRTDVLSSVRGYYWRTEIVSTVNGLENEGSVSPRATTHGVRGSLHGLKKEVHKQLSCPVVGVGAL